MIGSPLGTSMPCGIRPSDTLYKVKNLSRGDSYFSVQAIFVILFRLFLQLTTKHFTSFQLNEIANLCFTCLPLDGQFRARQQGKFGKQSHERKGRRSSGYRFPGELLPQLVKEIRGEENRKRKITFNSVARRIGFLRQTTGQGRRKVIS